MFFIFNLNSYTILLNNKSNIINKINLKLKSPFNEDYELIGDISMASSDHFTCFITEFVFIKDFTEKFDIGKTYYHDGINNNGYF